VQFSAQLGRAGLALVLFAAFAGCNSTNPVTTLPAAPTPTPAPARSSTATATVGAAGTTITFPAVQSQSGGFTLPAASAGSGATLSGTFSLDPPSGIPAPQSALRSSASRSFVAPQSTVHTASTTHAGALYIAFSTSSAVTVSGTFHVTFTGSSASASSAFVAYYDGTAWQYDVLSNPSTATANTLDFTARTSGPLTFATGKTYVFALTTDTTSTPPPFGSPTPVPTPTPTPAPTIAPENYYPYSNSATYEAGTQNGSSQSFTTQLAAKNASLSYPSDCSAPLGGNGNYESDINRVLVPYQSLYTVQNPGQTPGLVLSKNAIGDVYVVGTIAYGTASPPVTCVAPYPLAKAQMRAGDSWTYTDGFGVTRTATVVRDHTPATFIVTAPGAPDNGKTTTYPNTAQVSYGSDQVIYWAAGYGPVQVVNAVQHPLGPSETYNPWTALNWVLDPNSK
jgi:hypothetical protein